MPPLIEFTAKHFINFLWLQEKSTKGCDKGPPEILLLSEASIHCPNSHLNLWF